MWSHDLNWNLPDLNLQLPKVQASREEEVEVDGLDERECLIALGCARTQAQIPSTLPAAPAAAPLNFTFMLEEHERWKGL